MIPAEETSRMLKSPFSSRLAERGRPGKSFEIDTRCSERL